MSKNTFPTTARERSGKVCLVWGLIVAEPDLEGRVAIDGDGSADDGGVTVGLRFTHIAIDAMDHVP